MKDCPTCHIAVPSSQQRCPDCGTLFLSVPAGARTGPLQRLDFHGDGMGLLFLHLKNMLLTPLTLGIYYFWGKVDVTRYLYGQTSFGGDRFSFHGTGWERFMGAARVFVLLVGLIAAVLGIDRLTGEENSVFSTLFIYATWAAVLPYAIVASRRFRLSRTALRGIRFSFRGDLKEFYGICLKGGLLTLVTLGLCGPFLYHDVRAYLIRHTRYGTAEFKFDGTGRGFLGSYLLAGFLGMLTLGLYYFWHQAYMERYFWDHTSVDGVRFQSTVTGRGMFVLGVTNVLLIACTLGVALPWATVRSIRYKLAHLKLNGSINMEAIRQDAIRAGAVGDEMADLLGVDLGV